MAWWLILVIGFVAGVILLVLVVLPLRGRAAALAAALGRLESRAGKAQELQERVADVQEQLASLQARAAVTQERAALLQGAAGTGKKA